MRDSIITTTYELTLRTGSIPSLDDVARASGVSKGGLMHHFPTRAALVEGMAVRAMDDADAALRTAALAGSVVHTWLRLSVPDEVETVLFRAMAVAMRAMSSEPEGVSVHLAEHVARWEELIAAEVGDTGVARVVRLVGDGLLLGAVFGFGSAASREEEVALVEHQLRRLTEHGR